MSNNTSTHRFTCTTDARFNSREWKSLDGTVLVFRAGLGWSRVENGTERGFETAREAFSGVAVPFVSERCGGFDFDTYVADFKAS